MAIPSPEQRPRNSVNYVPLVAKSLPVVPHNHPSSSKKTPAQPPPDLVTLPPCSNPCPIRTILTSAQIQPATQPHATYFVIARSVVRLWRMAIPLQRGPSKHPQKPALHKNEGFG